MNGGRLAALALCGAVACAPVYSRTVTPVPGATPASRAAPGGGGEAGSGLAAILGHLVWPLAMDGVEVMSSRYGPREHPQAGARRFHRGLDLRADQGTPVYAVADGTVARSGRGGAYGNLVILEHGEGLESLYAHHSRNLVETGERIRRGQVIALVGRTGNATGDHLHFELRWRGGTVDPWTVLPALDGVRGR
ncbi:MAG: M23 family metallopeptidase [Gemmatimonadota bacterium]